MYEKESGVMYRKLVGRLLHISNTTRPDITLAAPFLSSILEYSGEIYCVTGNLVLIYLKWA